MKNLLLSAAAALLSMRRRQNFHIYIIALRRGIFNTAPVENPVGKDEKTPAGTRQKAAAHRRDAVYCICTDKMNNGNAASRHRKVNFCTF